MEIALEPIDRINGISQTQKLELQEIDINFLIDFFLGTPENIASKSNFSLENIENWRSAALLLQMNQLTPIMAEALVKNRIFEFEELAETNLQKLQEILSEFIEEESPLEFLSNLKVEACKLFYSGLIQGQILDSEGNPISNVEVNLGNHSTYSNDLGIWRLNGIQTKHVALFFSKENFQTLMIGEVSVDSDMFSTELLITELQSGISKPIILDEYLGDDLPFLDQYAIKEDIRTEEDLRSNDILKVSWHYKNGDIKLVSIFQSLRNNEIILHCFRVPPTRIDSDCLLQSTWEFKNTELVKSDIPESALIIMKQLHKNIKKNVSEVNIENFDPFTTPFSVKLTQI